MEDHELHPGEAEAREEPEEAHLGGVRSDISREIVGLYKRYYGRGPVKCRTYLQPELVTVVLGGG